MALTSHAPHVYYTNPCTAETTDRLVSFPCRTAVETAGFCDSPWPCVGLSPLIVSNCRRIQCNEYTMTRQYYDDTTAVDSSVVLVSVSRPPTRAPPNRAT